MGANVVVELNSESHARKPTTRAWAIIRRADRAHRLAGNAPAAATAATPTAPVGPTVPADPINPRSEGWLGMGDDDSPDQLDSQPRLCPTGRHSGREPNIKAVSKLLLDAGSGQLSG